MLRLSAVLLTFFVSVFAMPLSVAVAQPQADTPYAPRPASQSVSASDAMEIFDVIARMNGAIDTNNYPLYASFYTPDGVIDSGFGTPVSGHAAIIASLEQSAPFITNKRHAATNIVLNRQARSVVATYYLTVFERSSGLTLAGTALIVDEFRKVDGAWRVVRHTTRMDPATIAAMMAAQNAQR